MSVPINILNAAASAWFDIFECETGADKLEAAIRYDQICKLTGGLLAPIGARKGDFHINMRPSQIWRAIHKERGVDLTKAFPDSIAKIEKPAEHIKRLCAAGYTARDIYKMGFNRNTVRKYILIHKRQLNEQSTN